MSEPFVFDPRCDLCKEPFGAAVCGTAVTFHCRPLASEHFSHCALVAVCEFSGTRQELELSLEGPAGERICFFRRLQCPAPAGAGLVSLPLLAGGRHRLCSG